MTSGERTHREGGRLVQGLLMSGGTAMVIGPVDAGKSFLVRQLAGEFLSAGRKVGIVDADVGQSFLCLPGAVGMKLFMNMEDLTGYKCSLMTFIGTANPAKNISGVVEAAERMSAHCRGRADITLVDTTGLVGGGLGKALKLRKIAAVAPTHIIALQREDEIEPILSAVKGMGIFRLGVSPLAKARTQAERRRNRLGKLRGYFGRKMHEFTLGPGDARFLLWQRRTGLEDLSLSPGLVIGLNRGWETKALGVVAECDGKTLSVRSPLASPRGIDTVVLGDLKI